MFRKRTQFGAGRRRRPAQGLELVQEVECRLRRHKPWGAGDGMTPRVNVGVGEAGGPRPC